MTPALQYPVPWGRFVEHANWPVTIVLAAFCFVILFRIWTARRGRDLYIRKIPGLNAIDEAVGRATEMGRPMMFTPGYAVLSLPTLQSLSVLRHVMILAAKYRTRVVVPTADSVVLTVAEEVCKDACAHVGRPEHLQPDDLRYLSDDQFAFASGCVGILTREKVASNIMFGSFQAEALILSETGYNVGAMQVAGTPGIIQVPFFIASCDYTIFGDEFYAASAYLSREPTLLGSLVGQDYAKTILMVIIVAGILLASILGRDHHWLKLLETGVL